MTGYAPERATCAVQSLIGLGLFEDFARLGLQGPYLVGDYLKLAADTAGNHLVCLLDLACQIDDAETGGQAADRVGSAVIGALMQYRRWSSISFVVHAKGAKSLILRRIDTSQKLKFAYNARFTSGREACPGMQLSTEG